MAKAWNKGKRLVKLCVVCSLQTRRSSCGRYAKTCSKECEHILKSKIAKKYTPPSRLGKRVPTAKHKHITSQGYVELYEGDTPQFAQLEHRRVMEEYLGRKLDRREQVHHINHNRTDNRIDNLIVIGIREHTKLHWLERNYA